MEWTGFIKRFSQPEGIREEMITYLRIGETERGWLAQDHTAVSWYLRQGFPQRLSLRVGRPGRGSRPRLVLAEGVNSTGGRIVSSILLDGPVGCLTGQAAPPSPASLSQSCHTFLGLCPPTAPWGGTLTGFPFFVRPDGGRGSSALSLALC